MVSVVGGHSDGPSLEVDADTRSAIATLFLLEQQLHAARPLAFRSHYSGERDVVLQVMADGGGLLSCFVRVSSREPKAAAELVLAYASWCAAGMVPSHDPRPLASSGRPLVDIVAEVAGTAQTPVAVVRDVRILGELLQEFSFDQILRSHVAKLQRAMLSSHPAQRHGRSSRLKSPSWRCHSSPPSREARPKPRICGLLHWLLLHPGLSMVQDLRELSLALVARMMDPRLLLAQARAARFLLGAFPCRWGTIVIVDAPASFGGLWRAAANFLPADFAESVQFMYRPEAEERLERMFGRKVL